MQFDVLYNFFIVRMRTAFFLAVYMAGKKARFVYIPQRVLSIVLWTLAWPHCPSFAFRVPHRPKHTLDDELIMQMARIKSEDTDLGIKLCCPSAPHDGKSGGIQKASQWQYF